MSLTESEQIAFTGSVTFSNTSSLIFDLGLTGVYLLAFVISMHVSLQKGTTGWAHKAMILLLLIQCGLVLLYICGNIIGRLVIIKYGLVISLPGGLEAQELSATSHTISSFISERVGGNLINLIADTIIVWRAWAICAESRITKSCLVILILADMGITMADSNADAQFVLALNLNTAETLDWIATAMNLVVNTIATLLIVHKAWTYHISVRAVSRTAKTQVQAILLLLIESGAILAVIQALGIVIQALDLNAATNSPLNIGSLFFASLFTIGSALNPVAIVILVHTQNTYEHSFHLEEIPAQSIQVATEPLGINQ